MEKFKIANPATSMVRKNKTLQLTATGPVKKWESSNPASVKINEETGLVTGVKAGGSARITAKAESGESYTITVTVDS